MHLCLKEAFKRLTLAADKGNAEAMELLGLISLTGAGVPADEKKSKEMFERARKASE